jgi:hypothetical protein
MPQNHPQSLTTAALALGTLGLLAAADSWHARLLYTGISPLAAWTDLLFPTLLGLMFGLTLRPKYVWGYSLFTLGLTGSLIAYKTIIGFKNDGFVILYAVLLMATVQTAVLNWRHRSNPEPGL